LLQPASAGEQSSRSVGREVLAVEQVGPGPHPHVPFAGLFLVAEQDRDQQREGVRLVRASPVMVHVRVCRLVEVGRDVHGQLRDAVEVLEQGWGDKVFELAPDRALVERGVDLRNLRERQVAR
jgi:hypothetical protein